MDLFAKPQKGQKFRQVAAIADLACHAPHQQGLLLSVGIPFPIEPTEGRGGYFYLAGTFYKPPIIEGRLTVAMIVIKC